MDRRIKSMESGHPIAAYALIALLAALLVLPAAIYPRAHDSFWITWVWADQFTAELQRGVLYPKWLPASHGGLGSPVFYYYPPLSFYLSGLLGLLGLSTYASVISAFSLGLAASGAAMYHWLKGWTRLPLHGALFYMAAPYHMFDLYGRGALAESVAIAFVPLVALGIRRISAGEGPVLLALAYAGLIATHLPLALLTSLFLVAPYGLILAAKRPRMLLPLGTALGLGIGLSAIYLVPALLLERYRDVSALWAGWYLRAENWSLDFLPESGGIDLVRLLIAAIVAALLVPILYLVVRQRSGWAAYAAFCCLLVSGLVPVLWSLPLLESVQFPSRVLPLAEFAIATGIALSANSSRLLALAALPPLALSLFFVTDPADPKAAEQLESLGVSHPDVPENLPPGDRPYSFPSKWALDVSASHQSPKRVGDATVLPTFYFPAWSVRCADGKAAASFPDPETGLLSYRGTNCKARLGWTPPERAGALTSAGALLILLLAALLRRNRRAGPDAEARPA